MNEIPAFKNEFAGLVIYDPQNKKVLYEHNPHKYFTPASNTKLLTFYTGIKILGDSIPHLKYLIRGDTLFFKGTGDPGFLNPVLPKSPAFDLLKNTGKELVLVPPYETIKRMGPGWSWDDYNAYYSAERSAFPVYGNLVEFKFKNGNQLPEVYPRIFTDSLKEVGDESFSRVKRNSWNNIFQYHKSKAGEDFIQYVPYTTSEITTANLLEDTLKRQVAHYKKVPKMPFLTLYSSASTDSLYTTMLQESDNFLAEQILLMASQELSDTLRTSIAIDHMQQNYLKDLPDPVIWVDGSGLSRYNLTTPANTVALLEKIKNEIPYRKLFMMLPAGGVTGTLKNRLKAEEPFVFAKTGSLSNNHSVSGYLLTKKGKILIFSFMNSNFTAPSSELRKEMDRLLFQIRDSY